MKKTKKEKNQNKPKKVYTQEKYKKLLKITLGSYVIVSLVSAFTSNFILALLTILCIALLYVIVKRKPPEELPQHLSYISNSQIDISCLPEDYQDKIKQIFVVLYQDAERNERLIKSNEVISDGNENEKT